ncbi:uncharacterized protein LOC115137654 [Oncorhynchus nerka]|uniref:uncharacterized protein LOC115137654 n=1 Tax=Oncorhynchus nerka TaxID=8023 RepID=UPI0031B85B8F
MSRRKAETPGKVYSDMTNNPPPPPPNASFMPVYQPRNLAQVKNTIRRARDVTVLDRDELVATHMMGDILPGFVTHMETRPATLLVVAAPEMVEEAKAVIKSKHQGAHIFHYDPTFDLSNVYVSPLVFRHVAFQEAPVLPLAFLIHTTRHMENHKQFFRTILSFLPQLSTAIFCTDREAAIEGAIQSVLPQARIVNCWNHISNNVKHKMGSEGAEAVADYQQAIKELLATKSRSDYECTLARVCLHWSPDFKAYFHQSLSDAMDKSAQYVLNSLGIQSDGITNNCSESFNAVLKALVGWKTVRVDKLVYLLYQLQTNALREVLQGYCNLGNFHLTPECHEQFSRRMPTTSFPYHMSEEDMVSFAEGIQSCVAQEEVVMAETGVEALARMIVAKGPSTKSFLYQGFSDEQHVVTLLPTETCSCSASDRAQRCVHRLAAVLAIGGSVDSPMPIKLRTRHLAAKRSGHKCATKEHVQTGTKQQEEQSTVHQQGDQFQVSV